MNDIDVEKAIRQLVAVATDRSPSETQYAVQRAFMSADERVRSFGKFYPVRSAPWLYDVISAVQLDTATALLAHIDTAIPRVVDRQEKPVRTVVRLPFSVDDEVAIFKGMHDGRYAFVDSFDHMSEVGVPMYRLRQSAGGRPLMVRSDFMCLREREADARRSAVKDGERPLWEPPASPEPIPMLLWCPECGERHIDEGDFATKSHHTHACQGCGHCWRPAVVPTIGVRFLPGFKNESTP